MKKTNKSKTLLASILFFSCGICAFAQMHTVQFGFAPEGLVAQGGVPSDFRAAWQNNTGQYLYIWGVQGDLWLSIFTLTNNSLDAIEGPGATFYQNLRNICDISLQVQIEGGDLLIAKGSDHYSADPSLNARGPIWFPRPFLMAPAQRLILSARAYNGYQSAYGGSVGWNANAFVYFTIGTP